MSLLTIDCCHFCLHKSTKEMKSFPVSFVLNFLHMHAISVKCPLRLLLINVLLMLSPFLVDQHRGVGCWSRVWGHWQIFVSHFRECLVSGCHLIYTHFLKWLLVSLSICSNLAVGIGIQNFPEGLAVSLPLRAAGMGTVKSFW